ncbi:MAG TPA: Uma2 family endonuclease [Myxococcus sp.]|jgi:Uma2 family endonuclease|nr:Uma2 family endonuclease [Myxococcus sp.]
MQPTAVIQGVSLPIRKLSPEEFEALLRAGIFGDEERIELLDGVLIPMSPIGAAHNALVIRLTMLLTEAARGQALVSAQGALALGEHRPQPDLALLPLDQNSLRRLPSRALLVIEVADTSLERDRAKAGLYAKASIPELWIVDVARKTVEVHTEPDVRAARYQTVHYRGEGTVLTTSALPALSVSVSGLFAEHH